MHGVTGFQVATVEEMTDALGRLLADRGLRERMGVEACKQATKFDWDVVAKVWESAYLETATGRAG